MKRHLTYTSWTDSGKSFAFSHLLGFFHPWIPTLHADNEFRKIICIHLSGFFHPWIAILHTDNFRKNLLTDFISSDFCVEVNCQALANLLSSYHETDSNGETKPTSLAKRGETGTTNNKNKKHLKRKGRKQGQNNTKFKSVIFQRQQHRALCHTGIKKPFKYSFGNS